MSHTVIKPPKSWDKDHHMFTVLKSEWYKTLSLLQDNLVRSTIEFYSRKDFMFMLLPITTGTISSPMGLGSDSLPVKINIQGIETYLADSMQFLLEFGLRIHEKGTYYLAPSFRGEKADARHLCQFFHSEAEIVGNMEDVMALSEEYIIHLTESVLQDAVLPNLIRRTAGTTSHLEDLIKFAGKGIPRVTFAEARELLNDSPEYFNSIDGHKTINSKGERVLMNKFNGFVWLTHFDHMVVPFYQAFGEDGTAKCADLLFGIGETIGSGERHLDGNGVRQALKIHNIPLGEYDWYIKLKDQVVVQTAGFGMGLERFLAWLLKHDDVRDLQLLPRFNGEKIYF